MKGRADIVSTIHNLKLADEHMQSFIGDRPTAVLTRLFKTYRSKIEWMLKDMKSEPLLTQMVRDGINQELNSDVFAVPAINEKVALLSPAQREMIELIIDQLMAGEQIQLIKNETTDAS